MSKKGQIQKKYSPEFKICFIMDMREHRLSYLETVRKYELGNDSNRRSQIDGSKVGTHILMKSFLPMLDRSFTMLKVGSTNMPNTNGYLSNITLHKVYPEKKTVWTMALWKISLVG